jgi:hypothetical protein
LPLRNTAYDSRKKKFVLTIINKLNVSIIRNFSSTHKETTIFDSLDIILFRVKPNESIIEISGIKRPFIHYDSVTQQHHYHNLKGQSIGMPINSTDEIPFQSITYSNDDYFYFFSDGITDQFGGPHAKKLMKKGLLDCLDSIKDLPPSKRQIELDMFLRKWQHNIEQTDDIIFMGISPSNLNPKYIMQQNN